MASFRAPASVIERDRLNAQEHELIAEGVYYFHVLGEGDESGTGHETQKPYAVVPSFDDWCFHHQLVPQAWLNLNSRDDSVLSDYTSDRPYCMITGQRTECQVAHMIPRVQLGWSARNAMSRYCSITGGSSQAIYDTFNVISLRSDIHKVWDRSHFSLVAKIDEQGKTRLVVHMLRIIPDIGKHHHNRAALIPRSHCRAELLFARFALQVLSGMRDFFLDNTKREVLIRTDGGASVKKSLGLFDIPAFQPRSRTPSPQKRSRAQLEALEQDHPDGAESIFDNPDALDMSPAASDSSQADNYFDSGFAFWDKEAEVSSREAPPRGRKRRRSS